MKTDVNANLATSPVEMMVLMKPKHKKERERERNRTKFTAGRFVLFRYKHTNNKTREDDF